MTKEVYREPHPYHRYIELTEVFETTEWNGKSMKKFELTCSHSAPPASCLLPSSSPPLETLRGTCLTGGGWLARRRRSCSERGSRPTTAPLHGKWRARGLLPSPEPTVAARAAGVAGGARGRSRRRRAKLVR
jgi:hypothetical protein